MPKVSVLTPLYNTNKVHLQEMIVSVLGQSFGDFEFILLNDSPENKEIEQIVKSYKDKRIRYYCNEKNFGISASRNKLIELATGEYLAVCDHDDVSMPCRFEEQVSYLDHNPEVGVVSGLCEVFGGGAHVFQQHPEFDLDIKIHLTKGCYLAHPASMIRKSVLVSNNISYNEKYSPAEDYKLWEDLMDITNFYNIQKVLLKYRSFEANTSVLQNRIMIEASRKIQLEIRDKHPSYYDEISREIPLSGKTSEKVYYKLFGIVPLIKITQNKVYLFNVVPLLTIRRKTCGCPR